MPHSDRRQYKDALHVWDRLRHERAYSVSPSVGTTAIICSFMPGAYVSGSRAERNCALMDPITFEKEALALADRLKSQGKQAEVALDAGKSDLDAALKDPKISDITVIGHGQLSTVAVRGANGEYSWRDVAIVADHLKLGLFEQRHCGTFGRDLSVPLGLFGVSDHRSVIAPVGIYFAPEGIDDPQNSQLAPVTELPRMGYGDIKTSFPHASDL